MNSFLDSHQPEAAQFVIARFLGPAAPTHPRLHPRRQSPNGQSHPYPANPPNRPPHASRAGTFGQISPMNQPHDAAVNLLSSRGAASHFSDIACFGKDSDCELTKSNEWVWAYSNACYRKTQTDIPCGASQQIGYGFELKRVASTGGDDCRSTHPRRPHDEPPLFLAQTDLR